MKRIASVALAAAIFLAGGAFAHDFHHARNICQDQSQTRPGRPPAAAGQRYRGKPGGPPSALGVRPQGPVTPGYGYGGSQMNRQRSFDRQAYQRNTTAVRHYHNGAYVAPPGWTYRRWAYGQTLPAMFWAQNYWLASWAAFGLMQPPSGYQWVRYGNDAILVDTATGQILQVQYGIFY
jgi:Ni/Co efflux regulator RcnB